MNQFLHASRGVSALLDRVVAITVIAGRSFLDSTVGQAFGVDR